MTHNPLRSLHHIALGTRGVERLASFYREVFALEERARFKDDQGELRSIWLSLGDTILMIERTADPPRFVERIGAGPFLLAFAIDPRERAVSEQALERAGALIESRTEYSSYARDPDGNRIAISHYPEPRDPRAGDGQTPERHGETRE